MSDVVVISAHIYKLGLALNEYYIDTQIDICKTLNILFEILLQDSNFRQSTEMSKGQYIEFSTESQSQKVQKSLSSCCTSIQFQEEYHGD